MLAGGVPVQRAATSSYRSTLALLLPEHATNYANRERKTLDLFYDRWPSVCNFFFPFVPQDPLLTSSLTALTAPTSEAKSTSPTSTSSSTSITTTKSTSPTSSSSSKLASVLQQALSDQATKADEDLMDAITRLPTFDVCLSSTIKSKEYPSTHLIYAEFDKESQIKLQLAYDALAKKFPQLLTRATSSTSTSSASTVTGSESKTTKEFGADASEWIPHVILAQADDKTSAINLVTRISEKWVPQKFTVETLTWLARDTTLDSKFVEYKTYPLGVAASSLSSLSGSPKKAAIDDAADDAVDAVEEEDYGDFDDDAAPTMTSEWDDLEDSKPQADQADLDDPVDEHDDAVDGSGADPMGDGFDDFGDVVDDGGASPMGEGDDESKEEKKSTDPESHPESMHIALTPPTVEMKSKPLTRIVVAKADKVKVEKMLKNSLLNLNQVYSLVPLSKFAIADADASDTVIEANNDCWCWVMRVDRATKRVTMKETKLMLWSQFAAKSNTSLADDGDEKDASASVRVALPLYISSEHYAFASQLISSDEWSSTMRQLVSEKEWSTWKSSLIWWRLLTELVLSFDGTGFLKMAIRETALAACRQSGLSKCYKSLQLINRYKSIISIGTSTTTTTTTISSDESIELFDAVEIRGLPLVVAWLMDLAESCSAIETTSSDDSSASASAGAAKHLESTTYAVFFDDLLRVAKTTDKERIRTDLIHLAHFSSPSERNKSANETLARLVQTHLFDKHSFPRFFVDITSALKCLNKSTGSRPSVVKLKKKELIKLICNVNSQTEIERARHDLMLAYAASHEFPPCPQDLNQSSIINFREKLLTSKV